MTYKNALAQRYRGAMPDVAEATETIATQLAHRSVRFFADEPVADEVLHLAVAAAQSASTSSNTQPWSVVVVRDPERRARLSAAVNDNGVIERAPVLLVWVADLARNTAILRENGVEPATLGKIENTLVGFVDTALAAQNALLALESLGFGGVFLGCIRNAPEAVAEELALPEHTIATFALAVGRPDPAHMTGIKARLPQSAVLHHETYDSDAWRDAGATYERSLREYYVTQGIEDFSWLRAMRAKFGSVAGMSGRETMRDSLRRRGLPSE